MFLDIVNHSAYEDVKTDLKCLIDLCSESEFGEFIEASNMNYIANSFIDKRLSNDFTEELNDKIKVIKRVGFGYENFEFFRLIILYILKSKDSKKAPSSKNKK